MTDTEKLAQALRDANEYVKAFASITGKSKPQDLAARIGDLLTAHDSRAQPERPTVEQAMHDVAKRIYASSLPDDHVRIEIADSIVRALQLPRDEYPCAYEQTDEPSAQPADQYRMMVNGIPYDEWRAKRASVPDGWVMVPRQFLLEIESDYAVRIGIDHNERVTHLAAGTMKPPPSNWYRHCESRRAWIDRLLAAAPPPAQPASVAEAEDARLFRALVCRFGPERNQTTEGRPHDILLQLRIEPSEEVYRPDGSLDFEASIRNVLEAECAIQAAAPQPPAKESQS